MQFDFTLAANQSQHIDVVGTFIKYKDGTGKIRVRLNGGGYIDLLPGQGVNNVKFTSVDVQDRTGAQNVGTILAGIYDFRDDRITGTVDVVDGGKARTLSGQCFATGGGMPGGATTDFPYLVLNNAAGSGKRIIVEEFGCSWIDTNSTDPNEMGYANAFIGSANFGNSPRSAPNKISGGVGSTAQFSIWTGPALVGNYEMYTRLMKKGDWFTVSAREPIIILPGWNFHLRGALGATTFSGFFDFYEETI